MGKFGQPNENEKAFFEAINDITQICQYHLQEEFGPSPFCYKQIEYFDKKNAKGKRKKMIQQLLCFTLNIFTLKKQIKYFPYLQQSENKKLILSIFSNSIVE